MTKYKPIQISKYLSKSDTDHTSIWAQANKLVNLNKSLKKIIPSPLNENCGIANIDKCQLTLFAKSSAWCYKLRLHSSLIVKFLKKKGIFISYVKVIVLPKAEYNLTRNLPKPVISEESKQIINAVSNYIIVPGLQETLKRLSQENSTESSTTDKQK